MRRFYDVFHRLLFLLLVCQVKLSPFVMILFDFRKFPDYRCNFREWMLRPLCDKGVINNRLDGIGLVVSHAGVCSVCKRNTLVMIFAGESRKSRVRYRNTKSASTDQGPAQNTFKNQESRGELIHFVHPSALTQYFLQSLLLSLKLYAPGLFVFNTLNKIYY